MGFFDKLTNIFEKGVSSDDPLHKVTKEDHDKAIIKERPDLCISITETLKKPTFKRTEPVILFSPVGRSAMWRKETQIQPTMTAA